jgi:hypothetical protein
LAAAAAASSADNFPTLTAPPPAFATDRATVVGVKVSPAAWSITMGASAAGVKGVVAEFATECGCPEAASAATTVAASMQEEPMAMVTIRRSILISYT